MELKRVVVTGFGAITPIGNNAKEYWENLIKGESGAAPITLFDSTNFKTKFACEVKNFNALNYFDKKEAKKMDRNSQFGQIAAREAIAHSRLIEDEVNKDRVGVIWGSGIGGLETFETEVLGWAASNNIPRFNPFFIPKMIADITPGNISIEYGFHGPNYTTVSACASSANALIDAKMLINLGKADVIVCGGSEAAVTASGMGGFNAMHALSTRNDDPKTASRPFDKDRDGFVLGEGAGVLVLEEYEHAVKRGARIYGEFVGYGMSSDAHHITAPDRDGPRRGILNAVNNAGINADQIQYVNAHGTSTPLGDKNETEALKLALGEHAYKVVVNSTKSMTGHLLGAAGGIEAVFTTLAVHNQVSPPTINIFNQDPECDLDYCANQARDMKIDYALSNSFGFGGTNGSMIVKRV